MNGSDCGMFTCKYADYITKDKPITFTQVNSVLHQHTTRLNNRVEPDLCFYSQKHMPYFRRRMVWEIVNRKLLWWGVNSFSMTQTNKKKEELNKNNGATFDRTDFLTSSQDQESLPLRRPRWSGDHTPWQCSAWRWSWVYMRCVTGAEVKRTAQEWL